MAGLLDQTGIENFYDTIGTNDFARQHLFRVVALGGTRFTLNELMYMTTLNLPSREITNIPVPFMGLSFNVPGTAKYSGSESWEVKFRIPQNLSVRRKFEDWSRYIFDDADSTGSYNIPSRSVNNQAIIVLLDKNGNPLRTYTIFGLYLKTLGNISLDITKGGELMEQSATLAYQYWRLSR